MTRKFLGTVRFGNDHVAAILDFGDLQCGNSLITRVYFIEGLGHNLFSVGQFCDSDLELWHQRLSHLNFDTINDLARNDLVTGLPKFKYHKEHLCTSCEQGKSKWASYPPKPVPNSRQRLHLLNMDLCGPIRIASINGKRYILVIVDDYSRYTWVIFLRSKDKAPEEIKTFLKKITVLLQAPVIIVRADNGTKFKNQVLLEYFNSVSISHQASSIRTPQRNRVVERRNRTLVEAARTMLIFSRAPLFLWAEAIATVKPNISFLHVFKALRYPKNDREDIGKLGAKGDIGFFIGYSANSSAYNTLTTTTTTSNTVPTPTNSSSQAINFPNTSQDVDELETQQQHLQHQPATIADNVLNAMFDDNMFVNPFDTPSTSAAESSSSQYVDPSNMHTFYQPYPHEYQWTKDHPLEQNVKKAIIDPTWIESMQEELLQFKSLDVWVFVPPPDNRKPLTLKWLFKNKHDEENTVIRDKTRLVMRGCRQEERIDFKESFASVARMEAIRLFLAYAAHKSFTVFQMDVKTAFLHGTIWVKASTKGMVRRIVNVSPTESLLQSTIDPTLFIRCFNDEILVVHVFVDDIIFEIKDKLDLDQNGTLVDATKYHSMIGALMYLTSSRPDNVHATCLCARYQAKPTEKHLKEDEDPFTGSNQGSKRRKSGKEVESSKEPKNKESKSTSSSKSASKSQPKSSGKYAHADEHDQKVFDSEDQSHQEFNKGNDDVTPDYFINNDLEYMKGMSLSQKYTTSITKSKAADFGQVRWIEDKKFYGYASNMESSYDVYPRHMILVVTSLKITKRQDDKLYKFREGDFKRLRRQDIEDMLLLLVQDKLTNLNLEEQYALNVALRMFTRHIVIQECIIYEDEVNRKRLIRTDELHKFSDGTLNYVHTALNDIDLGIEMDYLPRRK
nr:hypothetical protein [Tanacetum cinerariifolium]